MVDYLPTLVVSSDSDVAARLAGQLQRAGFPAEGATSCWAAHRALLDRFYGSLVCFVNPGCAYDLECVSTLRRRSLRTWIVLVTSIAPTDAHALTTHCGADALLPTPVSIDDLVARLAAFARRSRPPEAY